VGVQLFCALLRGAGLDARLVCSLQLLPFASPPPAASPQKQKRTIRLTGSDSETGHSGSDSAASSTLSVIGNGVTPKIPPPIKRFGRGAAGAAVASNVDLGQAPSPGINQRSILNTSNL
jgi:xeroderma pigmentosum group C-complementing protein